MAFQKFVPEKPKAKPSQFATVRPTGQISLRGEDLAAAGIAPGESVVLYFDPRKKAIGVEFVQGTDVEGALKISRRRGTVGVKSPEFLQKFRLKVEAPLRLPVTFDSSRRMAVIDAREIPRQPGRPAGRS